MKKILFTAPILFLLLAGNAQDAWACSCIANDPNKSLEQTIKEAVADSSAVFTARVLSSTPVPAEGNKIVKLRLVKSWKGKLTKTITLTTGIGGGGDCGYSFETGKTYLVYAYRDENKRLATNICNRTGEALANKDIAVLNKTKKWR
jgi:hypothetical protein